MLLFGHGSRVIALGRCIIYQTNKNDGRNPAAAAGVGTAVHVKGVVTLDSSYVLFISNHDGRCSMHDAQNGAITSVRFDKNEKYAITTAEDGLMFVYQIDSDNIRKEALFDPFAGLEGVDFMPEATKDDIKTEKTA
jgi:hypothetical protein